MIRSMTGYAQARSEGDWGQIRIEMRSVNHRYLDLNLRLPEQLRPMEGDIRNRVAKRLGRGKVECNIYFTASDVSSEHIEVNEQRLRALSEACRAVTIEMPQTSSPDQLAALAWPGVMVTQETDIEAVRKPLLSTLDDGLISMSKAREDEGGRMAQLIRDRAENLHALVEQVKSRIPDVQAAWEARLRQRIEDIDAEIDQGRIEQEIVMQATKMDVAEELDRLLSHIQELEKTLKRDEPVGRRLDFLMQEFNREANTLSSKSQDSEVTRMSVDMKVLIEQMREQVQNIE